MCDHDRIHKIFQLGGDSTKIVINGEEANFGSGGLSQDVYSTEETRIGTWIDGKPLYRKVVEGIFPSTTGWSTVFEISNIGEAIAINMRVLHNTGAVTYIFSDPSTGVGLKGNSVVYYLTESFGNKPFMCIIEYTKTTDMATQTSIPAQTAQIQPIDTSGIMSMPVTASDALK